ncbi:MAG TPA: 4a-hydroxytetrahydrobiopterin dehydratase [Candidatus Limnocylindria bacterium]|nr:4a-hydroxytetrahydrobiopterin dehydratase [Candidatus Limnocylindria bacterium]
MTTLPEAETRLDQGALATLIASGGWTRDGETLTKSFRCKGWKSAVAFVDRIAKAADEIDHHPDVHIESYRNVRIVTTTHATKKISDADVELARRIDALFAG